MMAERKPAHHAAVMCVLDLVSHGRVPPDPVRDRGCRVPSPLLEPGNPEKMGAVSFSIVQNAPVISKTVRGPAWSRVSTGGRLGFPD